RAAASAMHYAPIAHLGSTDLRTRLVSAAQVGKVLAQARPVRNYSRIEGVTFNRGPALELVEAHAGPLVRARIEDLVPGDLGLRVAGPPSRDPATPGRGTRTDDGADAAADREAIELTRRAAERAADEARRLGTIPGASPGSLPMVRPLFTPRGETRLEQTRRREARREREQGAPADTAR
ncbi:MAG: hypothetical protein ABIS67_00870, partial [Candidatus Eisenbacteria bacterium]